MSKKHFIALAAALKQTRDAITSDGEYGKNPMQGALAGWRMTVRDVANVCASTNPRFDRGRFLTACGLDD